ncbi:MAG: hypothetical protein HYY14_05190 [Candidatus Omnitrophica bacterium]|nr:hypothetical protein [Candidatus Omnitrophota bacterium]
MTRPSLEKRGGLCHAHTAGFLAILYILTAAPVAFAWEATTLISHGDPANRIDLVIVGDGYRTQDLAKYTSDVNMIVGRFFNQTPLSNYQSHFNVHRVDVFSRESGVDHPEYGIYKNTALDCTFNYRGIKRLVYCNSSKAYTVAQDAPAVPDITLVIVNDAEYGGSGGWIPVSSMHASAVEIILHELGHSFALLADEYTDAYIARNHPFPTTEPSRANITIETERTRIKWRAWIAPETPVPTTTWQPASTPGLYEGACYLAHDIFRPTPNSKMRSLGRPYEAINTEQFIKQVYNKVDPIDWVMPLKTELSTDRGSYLTFRAGVVHPTSHRLIVWWFLDNRFVSSYPSYTLRASSVAPGTHTIRLMVKDPTGLVRNDPERLLKSERVWTVDVAADTDMLPPLGDLALSVQGVSAHQVSLSWPDVTGESSYELEHSVSPDFTKGLVRMTIGGDTTSFQDDNLTVGTTYYYRLRACNSAGCTDFSPAVSASTPVAAPFFVEPTVIQVFW